MPIWVTIILVSAFATAAVILFVCAAFGFRQHGLERVLEGVAGVVCLWIAVGSAFADRVVIWSLLWLAAPVAALTEVWRLRRAAKLHQEQLMATYAIEQRNRQP